MDNYLKSLVKHYEGLNDGDLTLIGLQPKMDVGGIWTEGYGSLVLCNGQKIIGAENREIAYKCSKIKTEAEAEEQLEKRINEFAQEVDSLKLNLKGNERDALISFAYNVGFQNLKNSMLLSLIRKGIRIPSLITSRFLTWNHCNGQELKGLTARRQSEATLFLTGELKFYN
jgi:lysozyme